MARRTTLLEKLQRSIGLGRRKEAEDPLLLDKPLNREQRYNDITPLLAKFQIGHGRAPSPLPVSRDHL